MTEDIFNHIRSSRDTGWRLSAYDHEVLQDLHAILRSWLPSFSTSADVEKAAKALRSIEALISDAEAPEFVEIYIMRRSKQQGGLSAELTLSDQNISLGLTEYVWIGEQGFDHSSPTDSSGRPIQLDLTPKGSFDREMFERWTGYAFSLAPEGPNDFSAEAKISD